jgi:hypothetical protein
MSIRAADRIQRPSAQAVESHPAASATYSGTRGHHVSLCRTFCSQISPIELPQFPSPQGQTTRWPRRLSNSSAPTGLSRAWPRHQRAPRCKEVIIASSQRPVVSVDKISSSSTPRSGSASRAAHSFVSKDFRATRALSDREDHLSRTIGAARFVSRFSGIVRTKNTIASTVAGSCNQCGQLTVLRPPKVDCPSSYSPAAKSQQMLYCL